MSQIRVIVDGVYQWRSLGPANGSAGPHRPSGAIVQGGPGSADIQRASQRRHSKAVRAERKAARGEG